MLVSRTMTLGTNQVSSEEGLTDKSSSLQKSDKIVNAGRLDSVSHRLCHSNVTDAWKGGKKSILVKMLTDH